MTKYTEKHVEYLFVWTFWSSGQAISVSESHFEHSLGVYVHVQVTTRNTKSAEMLGFLSDHFDTVLERNEMIKRYEILVCVFYQPHPRPKLSTHFGQEKKWRLSLYQLIGQKGYAIPLETEIYFLSFSLKIKR